MSFTRGNGNGNGGPDPRAPIYTKDMLDEVKAFNAGLTQAGNKQKAGRGRGRRSSTLGRPSTPSSHISSAPSVNTYNSRPAPSSSTRTHVPGVTRSGVAASWGTMGPHTVGPSPPRSKSPVRQSDRIQSAPAPAQSNTGPFMYRGENASSNASGGQQQSMHQHQQSAAGGPGHRVNDPVGQQQSTYQQSAATINVASADGYKGLDSSPQVYQQVPVTMDCGLRNPLHGQFENLQPIYQQPAGAMNDNSANGSNGPVPNAQPIYQQPSTTWPRDQNADNKTSVFQSSAQFQQPTGNLSGVQSAVDNASVGFDSITSHEPVKPFIPAHLRQESARKALQEIADLVGLPISEISEDGRTLGFPSRAKKTRSASGAMPVQTQNTIPSNAAEASAFRTKYYQSSVDTDMWMAFAGSKNYARSQASATVGGPPRILSYELDLGVMDGVPINSKHHVAGQALPGISESRWANPPASGFNAPTPVTTSTPASNDNVEPAQGQQSTNNGFASFNQALAATTQATPTQSTQNPISAGFDPRQVAQRIGSELNRGSLSILRSASTSAQAQANPLNAGSGQAGVSLYSAVAAPIVSQPVLTPAITPASAPAKQGKTRYLASSRWAKYQDLPHELLPIISISLINWTVFANFKYLE
ncbi:uncharacterized protein L3040_000734 [Drepanopeziza brunnea f. sp. 'multigermtubi']|uniref:Uncharacterized protein n=1 Tax=Marssonina brunnea f. sp. multigermtubi (strain MB_m1) TaxID=1072389 RepID=K1Y7Y6_MARBU|nr:uncharacterized protein MBM_00337 [Drepanopeziza brunnea f. sp. 'multigermtubi' MB_m1]EKD21224.1 hypothetical protein MBM_00337 [Drepanopeziza brunnea f. sp. 'multigermtubi' MB_m1]KAJ5054460.1 hypothetical protein L3040_000734 [Drepanopeziza brunnea f. sp. 'multigermtubi']